MTDQGNYELSRRKVLAGLGTIGAAGAGVGMGTSAYFSDQETFTNNKLIAGELDMKVDWEEHYSDWSDDEDDPADSADPALDIQMDVSDASDYTAFPPGVEAFGGVDDDPLVNGDPLLYVHDDDVTQFMDNTSIDAYPDSDDDGVQDDFDEANACEELVDVGADDSGLSADDRTDNEVTDPGDPLINLGDVKPGDFGELTLSFHICDNPGYVWLNADNVDASENDKTEPEREDDDEVSTDDPLVDGERVELLDEIQTAWWYDENCDNLTDGGTGGGGGGKADIVFVIDESGSMSDDRSDLESGISSAANSLDQQGLDVTYSVVDYFQGAGVGIDTTTSVSDLESDLNDGSDGTSNSLSGSGGESLSNAISFAYDNLSLRSDAKTVIVGFTDEPDQSTSDEIDDAINEINNTNSAFLGVAISGQNVETELVARINESRFVDIRSPMFTTILEELVEFTGGVTGGEEIFFQGSLRAALGALTSDPGIPLDGDGGDDFDEINDDPTADSRGCFEPTPNTNCIGFSWWLPLDHGNEVQSDSVQFDLGFYTEQCRHNDGEGMANRPDS